MSCLYGMLLMTSMLLLANLIRGSSKESQNMFKEEDD